MRILKFGGSSLANGERIAGVAEIVRRARGQGPVAVVVSALGGVTNDLSAAAVEAAHGDAQIGGLVAPLTERHLEALIEARQAAPRLAGPRTAGAASGRGARTGPAAARRRAGRRVRLRAAAIDVKLQVRKYIPLTEIA